MVSLWDPYGTPIGSLWEGASLPISSSIKEEEF